MVHDRTADITYCANVAFSAHVVRQTVTDCGIFSAPISCALLLLKMLYGHFSRYKTVFSPNIIPPTHAEQDQIEAKWQEKSLFSDMRVEEQVEA